MYARTYKAHFTPDPAGGFVVGFYDVPEALTQGEDRADALANAADALAAALDVYLDLGRALPGASDVAPADAAAGVEIHEVAVEPAIAARALLLEQMQAQGLSKVALAERMGKDEKAVRRILAGKGASLDLTLEALKAVGVRPALAA